MNFKSGQSMIQGDLLMNYLSFNFLNGEKDL